MKLYQKALTYVTLGVVSIGVGLGILGCTTKTKVDNLEPKTEQTESEKKEVTYVSGEVKSEHTTVTGACGTNYWIYSFSLETKDEKSIIFRCIRDKPNKDIAYLDGRLNVDDKVKIRLTSSQLKPKILENLKGECIYNNISLDQVLEINGEKFEQPIESEKEVNYISGKVKSEHTTVTGSCGTNYWIYSFSLETEDKKDIIFRCVRDKPNDTTYLDDRLDVGDDVKIKLTSSQLKPKILEDLAGECGYDFSLTQIVEVNGKKFE